MQCLLILIRSLVCFTTICIYLKMFYILYYTILNKATLMNSKQRLLTNQINYKVLKRTIEILTLLYGRTNGSYKQDEKSGICHSGVVASFIEQSLDTRRPTKYRGHSSNASDPGAVSGHSKPQDFSLKHIGINVRFMTSTRTDIDLCATLQV